MVEITTLINSITKAITQGKATSNEMNSLSANLNNTVKMFRLK
jgi:hypothetical protein